MVKTYYIDGGCSGNKQKDISLRRMISVVSDESGNVLSDKKKDGGSNNIAELIAVRDCLKIADETNNREILIYTDSRNNLAWTFGRKVGESVNDRRQVIELKNEINELRRKVNMKMEWVPREDNKAGWYIEFNYGT